MLESEEGGDGRVHRHMQDPPIAATLFKSSITSWLWLVVRVWLGGTWLMSGWGALAAGRASLAWGPLAIACMYVVLGLALIAGSFVGIAAALGILVSVVSLSVSADANLDPLEFIAATLLVLAWKNAGYVGLDRYLLRLFGAPWWDTQVTHVSKRARASAGPPRRITGRT